MSRVGERRKWSSELGGWPREESNLRTQLRRLPLCPLSYGAVRVAEGTRTPDHRDHNPGLYQLSYRHRARTTG